MPCAISSELALSSRECRSICRNQIRSILKTFGLMAGKGAGRSFAIRVRELLEGRPSLAAIVDPLLAACDAVREQMAVLDRQLIRLAKGDLPSVDDLPGRWCNRRHKLCGLDRGARALPPLPL